MFTRRSFLKTLAATTAGACLSEGISAWGASSREKLTEFDYSSVKLTEGPLKDQFDRIHAAYLALDAPQVFIERPLPLPEGLKPVPHRPQAFELDQDGEKMRLEPYYSVGDEVYSNYLRRL